MSGGTVRITVTRQEPGGEPREAVFDVPYDERTSVLDALDWIKEHREPSLTYRWSCRSGVCGSCGVMVNGRPVLGCEATVSGYRTSGLAVGPLAEHEVQRDLAVDQDAFVAKLGTVSPWPVGGSTTPTPGAPGRQSPTDLAAYQQFSECINCLLCYSACPVLADAPDFLGPAAVALARRWDLDSRDDGAAVRAEALVENEHGIWPCIQDGSCTRVCPKGVDPARALRDYQREALG